MTKIYPEINWAENVKSCMNKCGWCHKDLEKEWEFNLPGFQVFECKCRKNYDRKYSIKTIHKLEDSQHVFRFLQPITCEDCGIKARIIKINCGILHSNEKK